MFEEIFKFEAPKDQELAYDFAANPNNRFCANYLKPALALMPCEGQNTLASLILDPVKIFGTEYVGMTITFGYGKESKELKLEYEFFIIISNLLENGFSKYFD